MNSESFSTLLAEAKTALDSGNHAKARNALVHCADLPLTFLQLTKLQNAARRLPSDLPIAKRIRLAIVATSTTEHLRDALRSNFRLHGIDAEIYLSPFDSVQQEVLNPNSGLYQFQPTHALLWLTAQNLKLRTRETPGQHEQELRNLWSCLQSNLPSCQILQTTFVTPPERVLGSLETRLEWSPTSVLHSLNQSIRLGSGSSIHVVDLDWLAARFGKDRWHDARMWFHSKHAFSLDATALVSSEIVRLIGAMSGLAKKCLVLDLDNTLWGGVIGDDGMDGIQVGESTLGEAFTAFQSYAKRLGERGVILAVCSKNNPEIAREPFRSHPGMVLRETDISCFVASWDNKVDNIRRIAETLEIGLDSLVFCDDNPAERKIVRDFLPEVYTVEMPEDPGQYVSALDQLGLFDLAQISEEDFKRTDQYRANSARVELKNRVGSLDDFLRDLQMQATVLPVRDDNWERPLQLINKSNQFNLLTNRYTPSEFQSLFKEPNWVGRSFRLVDRFGDNGLIAVVTARVQEKELFIHDWVMSCRVLSRGMENFTFNVIRSLAQEMGCRSVVGKYRPTKKNALVAELLPSLGFQPVDVGETEALYRIDVTQSEPRPHFIALEQEE